MKVSEFALKVGTTPDTVRYYARIALLNPLKDQNGYKQFSAGDVARMKFILNARQLGFSVADITQILAEADKGKTACPLVRELIQTRLIETERQFHEMQCLRSRMSQAVKHWQAMADKAPTSDMICHLIDQFFTDRPIEDSDDRSEG